VFVWLLHQPASASWLKRELAERRPDLRFAFSRPGLTTFKTDSDAPVESSFARAWGQSLGRADDVAAIAPHLATLQGPLRLHVFERDLDAPADERASVAGSRARDVEAELRAAYPDRFEASTQARVGDRVLDVITAPAERDAEPLFVGTHVHDDTRGPFPGGVSHVAIPDKAPSRAWAKIEEGIRWSQLVPMAGETAVEIGSAPGGASYALLERGLTVHGIDPGGMAPIVMRSKRFVHHAKPAAEVERRDLPEKFEWLASDVNLAPMVALKYIERFVALAHGGLKGAFLTLKVHDDGVFRALPYLRERIEKLGGTRVRITQLPSHRNEVIAIVTF
jgi:23S rRNA (cytidine2498-2'-O)-methyltransferase